MSRSPYLTPSKIGLLALISIYTESVVPATATIPILSFLARSTLPTTEAWPRSEPVSRLEDGVVTIDALQQVTLPHASGIPGRTLFDLLLIKLWSIDSLDSLHAFFRSLSLLLQRNTEELITEPEYDVVPDRILLSRKSPLGAYVCRAQKEFKRLKFHDSVALWKKFATYRLPTLAQWKKRNPKSSSTSFDVNLEEGQSGIASSMAWLADEDEDEDEDGDSGISKGASVSTDDIEKLLQHQLNRMQRLGTRIPEEMLSQLRRMAERGISMPDHTQYVEFLDAWQRGDYSASFDNLHRYFDYTMHNNGDRTSYQYALLTLAVLHADFGAHSEAILAIQETISTARDHNDLACLNYSLSWLYHFGKAHPEDVDKAQDKGFFRTDREALTLLKAKAKETKMWSILSISLLSQAKLIFSTGGSVSQAFESVVKASHVSITKNVTDTMGSQMEIESTIFARLGIFCQSELSQALFLQCGKAQGHAEDVVHCVCRSASLLAQRGHYQEALTCMEQVDQEPMRTLRFQQYWAADLGMLKLQRCLCRDKLDAAERILLQLRANHESSNELSHSLSLFEIDLQIRRKDYTHAMEILEKLMNSLNASDSDLDQRLHVMTLKARIYDKAGIPQKGFSVALRAAALARRASILPVLWEAIGAICAIFHSVKEFEASIRLMESILPHVLECQDCDLAAQSFSLLADAHVGKAGLEKEASSQRKEQLTQGLENLDRAFDEFSKIEDVQGQCEMLAKKATIMHLNGDPVLANDCAAQYLAIKKGAEQVFYRHL